MSQHLIDHLFRHQYGKMVSILTRIFGLEHLALIEDAVQDSFYKAVLIWRKSIPENPEAWLIKSARNRLIDILRKIKSDDQRHIQYFSGTSTIAIQEVFQEAEIEDSQLRMIFTACHPSLKAEEQICFALKTLSGFSIQEISTALLSKPETIKKRIARARKKINEQDIQFSIPVGPELLPRLERVHEVLYLIFNEGYQSNSQKELIRMDLMAEAIRLCQLVIDKKMDGYHSSCALGALMCFHASKANSKIGSNNEFINLEEQNRSTWNQALIQQGNAYMYRAVETDYFSSYHYEAAIVAEHLKVDHFDNTDWARILMWYQRLYTLHPTEIVLLNIAIVHMQLEDISKASQVLEQIKLDKIAQRKYLYYTAKGTLELKKNQKSEARNAFQQALEHVHNPIEKQYIQSKLDALNG